MQIKLKFDSRLANRWAERFSRQRINHAARVLAPTLLALSLTTVAHAQGTMDFSGAQTLMGTFNTIYHPRATRCALDDSMCRERARTIETQRCQGAAQELTQFRVRDIWRDVARVRKFEGSIERNPDAAGGRKAKLTLCTSH